MTTVQKEFKCPVRGCRSSYSQQYSLKQHFAAHHSNLENVFPQLMPRKSSFARRKRTEVERKYVCPVESCACGYEEKKLLKRHFRIKHPEQLNEFPDLIAEKRKWQRPGDRAYSCDAAGCTCSYASMSNLKQHMRVEHPELYIEKYPNSLRTNSKTYDDLSFNEDDESREIQEIDEACYTLLNRTTAEQELADQGIGGLQLLAETALQTVLPPHREDQLAVQHMVIPQDYHYPHFDHSTLGRRNSFSDESNDSPSRRQSQRAVKRKKCPVYSCHFYYFEESKLEDHMKRFHDEQEQSEDTSHCAKRRKLEIHAETTISQITLPRPYEEDVPCMSAPVYHPEVAHDRYVFQEAFKPHSVVPTAPLLPPIRKPSPSIASFPQFSFLPPIQTILLNQQLQRQHQQFQQQHQPPVVPVLRKPVVVDALIID